MTVEITVTLDVAEGRIKAFADDVRELVELIDNVSEVNGPEAFDIIEAWERVRSTYPELTARAWPTIHQAGAGFGKMLSDAYSAFHWRWALIEEMKMWVLR